MKKKNIFHGIWGQVEDRVSFLFSIFILYFFRENGLIFKSVAPVYRFREGESPLSRPDF